MAVNETGAIFKGFTFDGIDSKDYGVYISGDAVFNAPERDVEMIDIPGRNGSYALDNGRFSNITVTYPAGLFGNTEADFAQGISALRNMLASRKGYCRLEDEYNPDEYRMAVYRSGLDVEPAQLLAGEFNIVFDCKPQRFLKSGEDEISVDDGDTVTNPTLFESAPLVVLSGSGELSINDDITTVGGYPMGEIILAEPRQEYKPIAAADLQLVVNLNHGLYNDGDTITIIPANELPSVGFMFRMERKSVTMTFDTMATPGHIPVKSHSGILDDRLDNIGGDEAETFETRFAQTSTPLTFTAGTPKTYTATQTWYCDFETTAGNTYHHEVDFEEHITYDGDASITLSVPSFGSTSSYIIPSVYRIEIGRIIVDSSVVAGTNDVYLDMDLGEAYILKNGLPASVNSVVSFPAMLPTLQPGENSVTYNGTITDVRITPRWWEV